jgi:hypothetical protein
VGFEWGLLAETCSGVVKVEPEGTGLARVYMDLRLTNSAKANPSGEQKEGEAPAGARALWEVTNCINGHGLEVVHHLDSQGSQVVFRVRRKLTAWLYQRLRLYRSPSTD